MLKDFSKVWLGLARSVVSGVSPNLYRAISYYRNEGRLLRIQRKLFERYGPYVFGGPFRGMRYVEEAVGSVLLPKLVGCYEEELHPFIEGVIAGRGRPIVNIGCGEGYYAVGLLWRMREARCVAFDVGTEARRLCLALARRNGVLDRLELRGECNEQCLRGCLEPGAFVLCDCEGAEMELLDPVATPAFCQCDILVELHDFLRPGSSGELLGRFAGTHRVQVMRQQERKWQGYAETRFLGRRERRLAVEEFRPARMEWAMLTARSRGGG